MNEQEIANLEFWIKEAEAHEQEARYALDQLKCDLDDMRQVIKHARDRADREEKPSSERDWS